MHVCIYVGSLFCLFGLFWFFAFCPVWTLAPEWKPARLSVCMGILFGTCYNPMWPWSVSGESVARRKSSDITTSSHLVPQFNEQDPDTVFSLFERVTKTRMWAHGERVNLLQCVLTCKAQEAYSGVCVQESLSYDVKSAVRVVETITVSCVSEWWRSSLKMPLRSAWQRV